MKLICEICNQEFEHEIDTYCIRNFNKHLKNSHNTTNYEYTIKYERNGVIPVCKCGCGNPVPQYKGWNKFGLYYKCGHVVKSEESIKKQKNTLVNKYKSASWIYDSISKKDLNECLLLFKSGNISIINAAKKFNIKDTRTLRKYWLNLDLISENELNLLLKNSQYKISGNTRKNQWKLPNETLEYLHNMILNEPGKYTIKSLIKKVNELCIFTEIKPRSAYYLIRELIELYGDDFSHLLQNGYHSKEEIILYDIFTWFFGKHNIKFGYRLNYNNDNNNRHSYYYDFLIGDKILIEYDSTGFYHNENDLRDREKELFAIENKYIFIRLTKEGSKDVEFLQKIKNLI